MPSDTNTVLEGQGLKKYEKIGQLGFEITTPVWSFLNVGGRYSRRIERANETGSTFDTANHAEFTQDSVILLARATLLNTPIFRFDVMAGIGGSNTKFTIATTSQNGELTKQAGFEGGFASLVANAGVSASVGFNWIYFFVEGGYEQNKIADFTRTGTISSSIQEMNLSGPYFMAGIMLDGLKGSKK